jgi:Uma2 family endonuclease
MTTLTAFDTPHVAAEARVTVADLLTRADADRYELVDGELLETVPMDLMASIVATEIGRVLGNHVRQHKLGWTFNSDVGLDIFDEENFRKSDGGFISVERLAVPSEGALTVAPDLVIEVVSPSDTMNAVRRKVALYLSAGVRVVWLVEPAVRMITVYEPDARPISLIAGDKLVGGAILPGFEVAIEDLFPVPVPLPLPGAAVDTKTAAEAGRD